MLASPRFDAGTRRPAFVLWLLAPWIGLLGLGLSALLDASHPAAVGNTFGALEGAFLTGLLLGYALWYALALSLTWFWLFIAVPGQSRPGLWVAALALAASWIFVPATQGSPRTVALGLTVAAAAACHTIIAASLRARHVHRPAI
jgi:hypothetical protein